jgi:hypothetical protein
MQVVIILSVIIIVIVLLAIWYSRQENFDIPLRSSSAWDWNLGPGYGAGYGTGYAMWGVWPANLPKEPWRNWMWGRRPLIFVKPFTPVPQIDYNDAPNSANRPVSNYNVSLLPRSGKTVLAINGFPNKTLQLDRNRNYYFHIYTPGAEFTILDSEGKQMINPVEEGSIQLNFKNNDPDILYYDIPNQPGSGGVIYLNNTRWE